jgi:hypothetical protein
MPAPVQTQSQTPPQPEEEADTTLDMVMKGFRNSRNYCQSGFWETWEASWKLYNGQRVSIGYDGYADTFVPETYTEVQGIKAHLINGGLEIEFLPTSPDQSGDPATLQAAFNYAWYKDFMDQKIDATVTEYLVGGNCYIWSYPGDDGFPCQRVVSAKDCFFDPMITNYYDLCEWGYGGYRYITTLNDLKDATVINSEYDADKPESDENSQTVKRYRNLSKVGTFTDDSNDPTVKQDREEMLADAVLDDDEGQVECIVWYGKDSSGKSKMITLANRSVVIEEIDTPFQRETRTVQSADDQGNPVSFEMPEIKPFVPVAPFRNLVDPNLWYARGDVEIIGPSQERLNDTQAQKTDNLTYQLNRMWALDPNFAQKLDEIQSVPGAVFTIPPGALEQIPTQPIGPDADNEIARIKQEMQAATGANEAITGTLQTTGRQSAYQVNQNLVMLGARFQVKAKNLENEGMRILAQNMWKIMQIFITQETPIRVQGTNGTSWSIYNPGLYLGDWDVQAKLATTADSIKETQRQQAMQFYLLASKQPFVDQQRLFLQTAPQIFPEVTKNSAKELVLPPAPPQQPPTIAASLANNIQFQDLYPDEQAELLSDVGIEPSPLREDQTGINASPQDPNKVKANVDAINAANPAVGNPGGDQAFEQAGMQTAGSPPVGAPTSGVANMPRVPS